MTDSSHLPRGRVVGERATRRLLAGLLALVSALVVAWGIRDGRVETDVASYAGIEADRALAPVIRSLATSEMARSVVLVVERLDEVGRLDDTASRADAAAIAERLRVHDGVAWVRSGPDPAIRAAMHELYWPRRMALREDDPDAIADAFTAEGLRLAAESLVETLRGPTSALVSKLAPDDPFLAYPALLRRFERAAAGSLDVVEGAFVTTHGSAVVLLAGRASPFDREAQAPLEEAIDAAIAAQRDAVPGPLVVRRSGVGRFAVAAETSIRRESTLLSALGLVGVSVTLLLALGRLRESLLTILPLLFALLAGTAATMLVFGHVHALTLGFGGMLVGVVVDYPVHLVVHGLLEGRAAGVSMPSEMRARTSVRAGITLGAATTVVGFAGLAGTSYPGLRELAVFATAGVVAAVGLTLFVLPSSFAAEVTRPPDEPGAAPLPRRDASPPSLTRLHVLAASALSYAEMRPRGRAVAALVLVATVIFVGTVLPRVRFVDDAEALTRVPPSWLLEDHLVRVAVGRFDAARFVVARGDTLERALARNDEVALRLAAAADEHLLGDYRTVHTFLWSEALQRRNLHAFEEARATGLAERLRGAFSAAGLRGDAFVGTLSPTQDTGGEGDAVLRWSDLDASPIAPLVTPFVIALEEEDGVAIVSYVRGVTDVEQLRKRVESIEGVYLFDRGAAMRAAWRAHRIQILWVVSLGLVGVTLLVFVRHRELVKTVRAVAPALLAATFTLSVRTWIGPPLHLLDVVAALLVLSMGADYGVFLVESTSVDDGTPAREGRHPRRAAAATLVAMLVASVTTLWGFGTLALAANPAMQAIGITTAIGVASAVVFALLVQVVGTAGAGATGLLARASSRQPRGAGGAGGVVLLVVVALSAAAGCRGGTERRDTAEPDASGIDPARLPFDAALRQTVTVIAGDETHAVDVAVEIDAQRVVMVGVLPFGGRVFTVVATAAALDATVTMPDRIPIDPRLVFVDMARALLVDAGRVWSTDAPRRARRRGRSAFGPFTERWRDGCVIERDYPGRDPLHVVYEDPWCVGTLPARVRLEHPRLRLAIEVTTLAGGVVPRTRR